MLSLLVKYFLTQKRVPFLEYWQLLHPAGKLSIPCTLQKLGLWRIGSSVSRSRLEARPLNRIFHPSLSLPKKSLIKTRLQLSCQIWFQLIIEYNLQSFLWGLIIYLVKPSLKLYIVKDHTKEDVDYNLRALCQLTLTYNNYGIDVQTLNAFLRPIITVISVWNTGETCDMYSLLFIS